MRFETSADITLRTTITVEADSEDEAREKFKQADWIDDGCASWAATMEMVDWDAGEFNEVDEYGTRIYRCRTCDNILNSDSTCNTCMV